MFTSDYLNQLSPTDLIEAMGYIILKIIAAGNKMEENATLLRIAKEKFCTFTVSELHTINEDVQTKFDAIAADLMAQTKRINVQYEAIHQLDYI